MAFKIKLSTTLTAILDLSYLWSTFLCLEKCLESRSFVQTSLFIRLFIVSATNF